MITNDVVFDKKRVPLRDNVNHDPSELSVLQYDVWDGIWKIPSTPEMMSSPNSPPASPRIPPDSPRVLPDPPAPTQPTQQRDPTSPLGNLVAYHTISDTAIRPTTSDDDGVDHDSLTYSKVMNGPHLNAWFQAMSQEFSSLQAHGVGTLVEAPPGANILPGMWRLKRKRD